MYSEADFFKELVQHYKDYLQERLVSIILFGSHARGDALPGSDYDLFIVAEGLPESHFKRMMFMREPIIAKFPQKVSIIAKTRVEVESGFPSLYLDIGLDGKILYDKGYFNQKIQFIKKVIKEAGLKRKRIDGEFSWCWRKQPRGVWAIDWSGYHEF